MRISWVQIGENFDGKIAIIFLYISLNMCFGCSKSKELSHLDGSFEYSQHMFWLRAS